MIRALRISFFISLLTVCMCVKSIDFAENKDMQTDLVVFSKQQIDLMERLLKEELHKKVLVIDKSSEDELELSREIVNLLQSLYRYKHTSIIQQESNRFNNQVVEDIVREVDGVNDTIYDMYELIEAILHNQSLMLSKIDDINTTLLRYEQLCIEL